MSFISKTEYKSYRRLICCKIKQSDEKTFLKIIQKDGWRETRFGKRGAKYSILKEQSDRTRYHLRLFEVQDYFLVLVHHEPSFKGDVVFHLKGFWNQFRGKKEDNHEDDKLELANYQQGTNYFKEFIDSDATLKEICEFRITETELKIFTVKFGFISLKTPVEIYVADLKESLYNEKKEDFNYNIRKILEIMGFELIETNPDFTVAETPRIKEFTLLIQTMNLDELDLPQLDKIMKNFKATSTVIVCSKTDSINKEQSQKYARLKINVIHPKEFLKIFNIYLHTPISQDQLQQIFSNGGTIDGNSIDDKLHHYYFPNFLKKTTELFQYLKDQTEWVYFDNLEYMFVGEKDFSKQELKNILDFLTYPLVNLVLTKREKRRFRSDRKSYRAITNLDEIQFRLKNIERFLDKLVSAEKD